MKKIFIAIKHYDDYTNRECIDAICLLLEKFSCQTINLARDYEMWGKKRFNAIELMNIAIDQISSSDLILIETTATGIGLGVEAGYAYAKGIPVITIAREGAKMPQTLEGISCNLYQYKDYDDLGIFFDKVLSEE